MTKVRLQKYIAEAGIASRRRAEEMILEGVVTVNGHTVLKLGTTVDPEADRVGVRGRVVRPQAKQYLLLHKPAGYVTTARDPEGRPTVLDLVPPERHLFPVGRLDRETTGLLLLTNDGELANRLMHPRFALDKVYRAVVRGVPSDQVLERLRRGVHLPDGKTAPARVRLLGRDRSADRGRLEMVVHEGRKRQVRRMLEQVGHPVSALKRIRIGPLRLADMPQGGWRPLTRSEIDQLRKAVGLGRVAPPSRGRRSGRGGKRRQ